MLLKFFIGQVFDQVNLEHFDIAARTGHESIDITYRYAHLFPSKQKEMALSLTQVRNNKANDWKDLLEEDDKDVQKAFIG